MKLSLLSLAIAGVCSNAFADAVITDFTVLGINDGNHYSHQIVQENENGVINGTSSNRSSSADSYWQAFDGKSNRIGLFGDDHTKSSNNEQSSYNVAYTEDGKAVGTSQRYAGDNYAGQNAWQAIKGQTTQIGLTDISHTNTSNQYQNTTLAQQNEAGNVTGTSQRYTDDANAGKSVWQAVNGTTTRIGFFDDTHTKDTNNYQSSDITYNGQNEAGDVIGTSQRYNGDAYAGNSAWQAVNGTTTRIGLTDSEHTKTTDNAQNSYVNQQNEAGYVIGSSNRYNGDLVAGNSAWQYKDGTTTKLGLTDTEHTNTSTGRQSNNAQYQNESGVVAGSSNRYDGSNYTGSSTWQAIDGTTSRIGLTGADNTRASDNYQYNRVTELTESGLIYGEAMRYSSTVSNAGKNLWQAKDGVTTTIGLTDSEHTSSDNVQNHYVNRYETGEVLGHSTRYNDTRINGRSAWQVTDGVTNRLGFTDAEHTSTSNNQQDSYANFNANSGNITGQSNRYTNDSNAGYTQWQVINGNTIKLGLYDEDHTRATDNYQRSDIQEQNKGGYIIGRSNRYAGSVDLSTEYNAQSGYSAWVAKDGVTTRLGLTDSEHTSSDNTQSSYINVLGYFENSESGDFIGSSARYQGTDYAGQSAWQYQSGVTTKIGLYEDDTFNHNQAQNLATSGDVIGYVSKQGTNIQKNWVTIGGVTSQIGLYDSQHMRSDGSYSNNINYDYTDSYRKQDDFNNIIGTAQRYDGDTRNGYSVWQALNGVTNRLGLTDTEHTRSDTNYQQSWYDEHGYNTNKAGDVVGTSTRYNGTDSAGQSAWQAVDGITTRIGLTDNEHTRSTDNYQTSTVNSNGQNEAGNVIGHSQRYNGSDYAGNSSWQAVDGITTRIGLTDSVHTRSSDNFQNSYVNQQNESGDVIGTSSRYDGGVQSGYDAWYWDLSAGVHYVFDLFNGNTTDYSVSRFSTLTDDGLALGYYEFFVDDISQGNRAMGFTINEGFFDLGSILAKTLSDLELLDLYSAYSVSEYDYNTGTRTYAKSSINGSAESSVQYRATLNIINSPSTSVPEPSTLVIISLGIMGLASRRFKTKV